MSASETLRVGIIGLGVGERHLAAYAEHPACRVVALCDFSADKRRTARERYPDLRIVEDARDLLLAPDIDLVSIASYDDAHFEQLVMAIETGKHAFVEKPLCIGGSSTDIRSPRLEHPEAAQRAVHRAQAVNRERRARSPLSPRGGLPLWAPAQDHPRLESPAGLLCLDARQRHP